MGKGIQRQAAERSRNGIASFANGQFDDVSRIEIYGVGAKRTTPGVPDPLINRQAGRHRRVVKARQCLNFSGITFAAGRAFPPPSPPQR